VGDDVKYRQTSNELKARANRLHLAHQDMLEVQKYLDALETLSCVRANDDSWTDFMRR
jgi:uncharacterized protein YceH (UPF0502 family)